VLLVGLMVYSAGSVGGGDVKLLAGVAAWSGFPAILEIALYAIACGVILVVAWCWKEGLLFAFVRTAFATMVGTVVTAAKAWADPQVLALRLPFGVAVFLGVCTWFALERAGLGPLAWA